jgi:hypothetical protein
MKLGRNDKVIAKGHSLVIFECTDMGPEDGNRWFVCFSDPNGKHSSSLTVALMMGILDDNGSGQGDHRLTPVQMIFLEREADKIADY